jgi:hypothetical protein
MTTTTITFALLALAACAVGQTTTRAADAIEAMRWQRRVVVIFSNDATDQKLAKQRAILAADAAGVAERRLAVVEVIGDRATIDGAPRDDVDVIALRRRCEVGPEQFRVVLIGLDGSEKLRREEAVTTGLLFETIDRMPMRQDEQKRD